MTYNFNFAISATINASTVKEIVKAVVEEQTGRKVRAVNINVKMKTQGFQRDEYQVAIFEGVTVHFENDSPIPNLGGKNITEKTFDPHAR